MTLHSYHARTWRTERRRPLRRILGWFLALLCWVPVVGLWLVANGNYVQ